MEQTQADRVARLAAHLSAGTQLQVSRRLLYCQQDVCNPAPFCTLTGTLLPGAGSERAAHARI